MVRKLNAVDKKSLAVEKDHGIAGCLPDQHVNLKKLFAKRWHLKKRPALSTALALAALQFDGRPHHALDDARNAARLLPDVLPLVSK